MVSMDIRLVLLSIGALLIRSKSGLALEADCNPPQSSVTDIPADSTFLTAPDFPFRTDRVTRDECRKFKYLIPCSPVWSQISCNHLKENDETLFSARSRTYLKIECTARNRSEMVELVRNVSGESPTRAVVLILQERNGADDPVHANVFEPIRSQVIDLTVTCASKITTSKVYNVGILPDLFRLGLQNCRNLTIRNQDFTRLPRILMISFETSTIQAIERGAFTSLPALQSLQLELGIDWHLEQKDSSDDFIQKGSQLNDWDVETVRRLHCDCSFAWFRNFIKEKTDLFGSKQKGEVFVIGNHMSPFIGEMRGGMQFLSVDCARNLTARNIGVGNEFSYNTPCQAC